MPRSALQAWKGMSTILGMNAGGHHARGARAFGVEEKTQRRSVLQRLSAGESIGIFFF